MKQHIHSIIFASLIIPLFLLRGCSTAQVTSVPPRREPTAVQVIRVNRIPLNHYLPFPTRTITDPRAVQRLFDAVQALPRLSLPPVINCPVDLGLEFHQIFSQGNAIMQKVIIYPEGCRQVLIGESDHRVLTEPFFHLFVQTIGITESELVPMPLYSCTPHSPCLSPTPSP